MNIDQKTLKKFIGGTLYFRFVCFECGPDEYYLFRSKIVEILFEQDKIIFVTQPIMPNRFMQGEWTHHPIDKTRYEIEKITDKVFGKFPQFETISDTVLHLKIDACADVILRTSWEDEPEPKHAFEHFPKGHEVILKIMGDTLDEVNCN